MSSTEPENPAFRARAPRPRLPQCFSATHQYTWDDRAVREGSTVRIVDELQRFKGVSLSFCALACATCGLAFLTGPTRSSDLIGRLASPFVEDRRHYQIVSQTATSDDRAHIAGQIPGDITIRSMRWYVNGAPAKVERLDIRGARFAVVLALPAGRDRWTVFSMADAGGFAHFVPMWDPLFMSSSAPIRTPVLRSASFPIGGLKLARAVIDYATGGAGTIAIGAQSVVHWYSGSRMTFVGWAIDIAQKRAPQHVIVAFDRTFFEATINADRPDVAKVFANAAYTKSGFTVTIPSMYLKPGVHEVAVLIQGASGHLLLSGCHVTVAVSTM